MHGRCHARFGVLLSMDEARVEIGAVGAGGGGGCGRALSAPVGDRSHLASDLLALTKPGITRLVLVTTGVGFAIAAMQRGWTLGGLLITGSLCLIGTALASSGANALNQAMEHRRDALMRRTCARPVPAGRVSVRTGAVFGMACSLLGVLTLLVGVNAPAALVALATIVLYTLVYTPMKPLTPLSTHIGAIPGALPPLIGWTAAWPASESAGVWAGLLHGGGWSLVLLMAVWQMPHFMAIAWMHREDYVRGGHRVLAALDPTGRRTAASSLRWLGAMLPASLAPLYLMDGALGWLYAAGAVALWVMFTLPGVRFYRTRERADARKLFLASIAYLPLILLVMVIDAGVRTLL